MIALAAFALLTAQAAAGTQDCRCEIRATTAHYTVTVYNHCKQGTEYTCRDYVYTSVDRAGRTFRLLHGRMAYRVCATDDVTPCEMTGWVFRNGTTEYFVTYPEGSLTVRQNSKLLLREIAVKTEP